MARSEAGSRALPGRWLAAAALLMALGPSQHAAAGAPVRAVEAVAITVSDLDEALAFYTGVLPFAVEGERVEVHGPEVEHLFATFGLRLRQQRLRLGDERIDLVEVMTPAGRPIPPDSRSNDGWFQHVAIVVRDMERAYAHLRAHDVRHASTGPQLLPEWNPAAGGISAFYFKDPDGNHLEILHFPPGKGDPRWQEPGDDLFRGIDHTAIVVEDTDAALRFYRDTLGLEIAGTAENWGPEQERLNNVFGARLRITALAAEEGPGIELLEYLAPEPGRPMPADTTVADLWHWHVTLDVEDPGAAADLVRRAGFAWASPGAVDLASDALGFTRGALVRDPSGHALLLADGAERKE
jgi:catechol 2,3-dioxygenase-like lactoylglutathione lyase family enzyme